MASLGSLHYGCNRSIDLLEGIESCSPALAALPALDTHFVGLRMHSLHSGPQVHPGNRLVVLAGFVVRTESTMSVDRKLGSPDAAAVVRRLGFLAVALVGRNCPVGRHTAADRRTETLRSVEMKMNLVSLQRDAIEMDNQEDSEIFQKT